MRFHLAGELWTAPGGLIDLDATSLYSTSFVLNPIHNSVVSYSPEILLRIPIETWSEKVHGNLDLLLEETGDGTLSENDVFAILRIDKITLPRDRRWIKKRDPETGRVLRVRGSRDSRFFPSSFRQTHPKTVGTVEEKIDRRGLRR